MEYSIERLAQRVQDTVYSNQGLVAQVETAALREWKEETGLDKIDDVEDDSVPYQLYWQIVVTIWAQALSAAAVKQTKWKHLK